VLNDFEAVGYGILALGPQDLIDINNIPAKPQVRASLALYPAAAAMQ
jgi:glucokinase